LSSPRCSIFASRLTQQSTSTVGLMLTALLS